MKKLSPLLIVMLTVTSLSVSAAAFSIKTQKNLNAPYDSKVIEKNSICIFDKDFYNDVNSAAKVGAGVAKALVDEQMEDTEANINRAMDTASSVKEENKIRRETLNIGSCYMFLRQKF